MTDAERIRQVMLQLAIELGLDAIAVVSVSREGEESIVILSDENSPLRLAALKALAERLHECSLQTLTFAEITRREMIDEPEPDSSSN